MKKTFIALVGALLLLAIVLLLEQRRDSSLHADRFAFDTTQKSEVNFVKVILKPDTAVVWKLNGQWVASPDSFPIDTAKIQKGLSDLVTLQSGQAVSTNASRLAEYGLDTAQAKHLEWRMGDRVVRVVLGKTSGTDYGSTYWKWEDKPEVFSTPGNFTWDLSPNITDWKDHVLFKLEPKDVKTVQVDWRDSTDALYHYKLEVVNDTLIRMVEPGSSSVARNIAQAIVSQCAQLSIDGFVTPGDTDLPKIAIDVPRIFIRMELKNGKSYELKCGRTFNTYVYAQHPFRKDIVKLSAWRFEPFKKKAGVISGRDTVQVNPPGPRIAIWKH